MANKLFSFFKQGNDTYEVKDAAARAALNNLPARESGTSNATGTDGSIHVNFANSHSAAPVFIGCRVHGQTNMADRLCTVYGVTASGFNVYCCNHDGTATANQELDWYAEF